jgi:hypothetical protein
LTLAKILRFMSLPFCPSRLQTYLAVRRFEDIRPERLLADGVRGVLIDVDGTLGPHGTEHFPESAVRHARHIAASGLKTAIYTNASESRLTQFAGIPVVANVHAKPDRRGFSAAMKNYLRLDDPAEVCMIGDNYVTDGGAVGAGMRFIYVHPIEGGETIVHRVARKLALLCARWHSPAAFRDTPAIGSRPQGEK